MSNHKPKSNPSAAITPNFWYVNCDNEVGPRPNSYASNRPPVWRIATAWVGVSE